MAKNRLAQLSAENQALRKQLVTTEATIPYRMAFARQMTADFFCIAAKRAFGFGPARQKTLHDVFMAVSTEYERLIESDLKADPDLWYLQAKLDEELQLCFGEHFAPWDDRYYAAEADNARAN